MARPTSLPGKGADHAADQAHLPDFEESPPPPPPVEIPALPDQATPLPTAAPDWLI